MSGSHDMQSYSRRLQSSTRAEKYASRFDRGSRQRIDRREQRAVRAIFSDLKECRSVLDVPCGAGRFLATLAQGGRTVLEMDVAFEILTFAQKAAVKARATAHAVQGDASRLPLIGGAVDCVFSNRLLHHILPPTERIAVLRAYGADKSKRK